MNEIDGSVNGHKNTLYKNYLVLYMGEGTSYSNLVHTFVGRFRTTTYAKRKDHITFYR